MGTTERSEGDDAAPELIRPEDFLPRDRFPEDARRMGLDRWSGAELGFVSHLDGARPLHRLVAALLLVAFLVPAAATLLFLLR